MTITLPLPQQEYLHFTLESSDNNNKLMFKIGSDKIDLDVGSPKTPTRLRVKQTPGAVLRKVEADSDCVWFLSYLNILEEMPSACPCYSNKTLL